MRRVAAAKGIESQFELNKNWCSRLHRRRQNKPTWTTPNAPDFLLYFREAFGGSFDGISDNFIDVGMRGASCRLFETPCIVVLYLLALYMRPFIETEFIVSNRLCSVGAMLETGDERRRR
jgi:hypothetical protein